MRFARGYPSRLPFEAHVELLSRRPRLNQITADSMSEGANVERNARLLRGNSLSDRGRWSLSIPSFLYAVGEYIPRYSYR